MKNLDTQKVYRGQIMRRFKGRNFIDVMFWYVLVEYGMYSASNFAAVSTATSTNSELDGR